MVVDPIGRESHSFVAHHLVITDEMQLKDAARVSEQMGSKLCSYLSEIYPLFRPLVWAHSLATNEPHEFPYWELLPTERAFADKGLVRVRRTRQSTSRVRHIVIVQY